MKAGPPSATPDLSYIKSTPCLDRALRRAQVVFNMPEEPSTSQQQTYGPWADPARVRGALPALQGAPDRWNTAILKRQHRRDQSAHKVPNRRSRGAPLHDVLRGVIATLRALTAERPDQCWKDILLKVTAGDQEAVLDHVTAYMHMKCKIGTYFSTFTVASHMACNILKRRGRSYPSAFCMVKAAHLVTVSQEACDIPFTDEHGLVPVYVMYFSRLEWHSGATPGEGLCEQTRFAYVLLLPVKEESFHGHLLYTYEKDELQNENAAFHRLIPIGSIVRPLIVDRSMESSVTLVPFEGKGLVDAPTADPIVEEEEREIDWENTGYDVD